MIKINSNFKKNGNNAINSDNRLKYNLLKKISIDVCLLRLSDCIIAIASAPVVSSYPTHIYLVIVDFNLLITSVNIVY